MKLEFYTVVYEWRWRLRARNGRIVAASSEGFATRRGAERNVARTMRGLMESCRT